MVFLTAQVVPAVRAYFSDTSTVCIEEDEIGKNKNGNGDFKVKKEYAFVVPDSLSPLSTSVSLAISGEEITPPPCLEKHIPPPNFC